MFSMSKANDADGEAVPLPARADREFTQVNPSNLLKDTEMSFHKLAPVKKNDCKKGAPAPHKKAPKKPAPAPRRRPVGHQG